MSKKGQTYTRYVAGYRKDESGILLPIYKTKTYTKNSVKRYMNCMHKLAKVGRCAVMYIHFLSEEMDGSNGFSHTAQLRSKFIRQIHRSTGTKYTDRTVKHALKELISAGLVITYGRRLDYTVNPLHYFKGSEKERKDLIYSLCIYEQGCTVRNNIKQAMTL